jgi:acyl-coenzyme A thioesterase PaaI-like protein
MEPHSPECYGCGDDNATGLRMQVWREGDEVFSDVAFQPRHAGAPGITHGGVVSAACDDLFGFVLFVAEQPGVTRVLNVEYRRPVEIGVSHRITARLDQREGRELHMSAEGVRPDGKVCFSARAVFLVVELAHFQRYGLTLAHPGLATLGRHALDASLSERSVGLFQAEEEPR